MTGQPEAGTAWPGVGGSEIGGSEIGGSEVEPGPERRAAVADLLVRPVVGLPEVAAGSDLAALLCGPLRAHGAADGDIVVVSSKIVSKALGLRVEAEVDRDSVVLQESSRVVAERAAGDRPTRIVETLAGPVMAGAGIDASNTGDEGGLLLLPRDPDGAAIELRRALYATLRLSASTRLGVLVTDTAGRPWRIGQTDFALGAAGLIVADDLRGGVDADGRPLSLTTRAVADEIAAAADLVKGKASGVPVALVRGLAELTLPLDEADAEAGTSGARRLVRTGPGDFFALGHVEAVRSALGVAPGSPESLAVGFRPTTRAAHDPAAEEAALGRAIALALHGQPAGAQIAFVDHATAGTLTVLASDPELRGRIAARLEIALIAESLDFAVETDRPAADNT
ncbi:MAG: coenzyme F420-0:L-glutamate ligase [Micrococcales bacterium]|nr:coenzyme F420-0:L-glutamate ligase [Micrococcales bacterium]